MKLKNDLVNTDSVASRNSLDALIEKLEAVETNRLQKDAKSYYQELESKLESSLSKMRKANLVEVRTHFTQVSDEFYALVKSFKLGGEQDLYWQYCPMANDDTGGYWLSTESEIRNPYFGSMMMSCGEVKEKI